MELFLLLTFAGTVAALSAEGSESEETIPESPEEPVEPEPVEPDPVDPNPPTGAVELSGTIGLDDVLDGTAGNDTITGNAEDQDLLAGGSGDDELHLGAGNTARGGAGADRFILDDAGSPATVIEDFELTSDQLALAGTTPYFELFETEDGTGLRIVDTLSHKTVLTLSGVSLGDGETLDVEILAGDGTTLRTVSFEDVRISAPFALDAVNGTSGDDSLNGTDGDDVIFGKGGADTLSGGAGDDALFSGSGTVYYGESYHHYPGSLTTVGDDGDVLDGGEGDDHLWIGPGTTATGGEGADSFHAFTNTYEPGTPAAEITDFDAAEDKLLIDFPVVAGFGPFSSFRFEDAIAGLSVEYDAGQDHTLIAMDGTAVATVPGDQSGIGIAFYDDYSTDEVRWRNAAGEAITPAQGSAASVIISAQQDQSVLGTNHDAGPA